MDDNHSRFAWSRWVVRIAIVTMLFTLVGCSNPFSRSGIPASITPLTLSPGNSHKHTVSSGDWPMYHRDPARTGYLATMHNPRQLVHSWNMHLDGAVYAEPLLVGNHLLVVTEGDSFYSLDTHTGHVQWRTNVGSPVPLSTLPCGNIDPLGITGTPIYDPDTGLIFAVAEVNMSGGPVHILEGVDVDTGQVRVRRLADPPGMQEPKAQQQRAALALSHGMVYIAYGGLDGDCNQYLGWVVASPTNGVGTLLSYHVPTTREGGIWATPGPVVDAQGNLYISVGNGAVTQGAWDHSDSVLRLFPTLQLQDGFAPQQWQSENASDADLGSMGPVLLPGGFVFASGKSGNGYILHADKLGGVGGQALVKPTCETYGGAAVVGSVLFVPCLKGVEQIKVDPGISLTLGWQAPDVAGSPVVGGQTVYSVASSIGMLSALDAASGHVRSTVSLDSATSRFATPTLSSNQVFVGTMSGVTAVTIM